MEQQRRLAYIDSLRAIAALLVLFGHCVNEYFVLLAPNPNFPFEWLKQISSAQAGVILFFALSGYVIPSSLQKEDAKGFIIRRFFRLYPLFWVSILPRAALYFWFANTAYSLDTILFNFTMFPGLFDRGFVVGVYWTLVHELVFYLLCLLLHLVGWLRQSQKIALFTLLTNLGYWSIRLGAHLGIWQGGSSFFQKTVLIFLSIMFWGALWRLWQEKEKMGPLQRIALVFIPLECALLAPRLLYSNALAKTHFAIGFGSSLAVAVGLFILGTTWLKLNNQKLAWLGLISYSLYLFHIYVIRGAIYFLQALVNKKVISAFSFLDLSICTLLGCLFIGALGYYFVERPSIRLGRWISQSPRKSFIEMSSSIGKI